MTASRTVGGSRPDLPVSAPCDASRMEFITPGQIAYDGYFKKCEGRSLISGVPLPAWADQSEPIRAAWECAAAAVLAARHKQLSAAQG